jgi:hypothetical protein
MTCIGENLKYLTDHGVTLSMDERMQMQLAMTELCDKIEFEETTLWGKLTGRYSHILTLT